MKVLLVHNFYQQPGGEDQVFADEAKLLESRGHEVLRYTVHNDAVGTMSQLTVAGKTIWNRDSYRELQALVARERPQVAHFQNTFPLISPAAYYAVRKAGTAVVQELPNYRIMCVAAVMFRDGKVCEDCLEKPIAWRGVLHKCYRGSRGASAVVATMTAVHRLIGTWKHAVDAYIALTGDGREKFIRAGLPADKIYVKSNFVTPDPGLGTGDGEYAIFVGRLSPEKGLNTLLAAWSKFQIQYPLKIVGDGPLKPPADGTPDNPYVQWLGRRKPDEAMELIGKAAVLICPSEWHETGGPKVILEALAKGTPVIAANLGSMRESVIDSRTGFHFPAGNAAELASCVRRLLADPQALAAMRMEARRDFEARFMADLNYTRLMGVYEQAIITHRGLREGAPTISS